MPLVRLFRLQLHAELTNKQTNKHLFTPQRPSEESPKTRHEACPGKLPSRRYQVKTKADKERSEELARGNTLLLGATSRCPRSPSASLLTSRPGLGLKGRPPSSRGAPSGKKRGRPSPQEAGPNGRRRGGGSRRVVLPRDGARERYLTGVLRHGLAGNPPDLGKFQQGGEAGRRGGSPQPPDASQPDREQGGAGGTAATF